MKRFFLLFFFLPICLFGQDSILFWKNKLNKTHNEIEQLRYCVDIIRFGSRNGFDSVETYIKIAKPLVQRHQNVEEAANFWLYLGKWYQNQNNYIESNIAYEKSEQIARSMNYEGIVIKAVIQNSHILACLGDVGKSSSSLFKIIPQLEKWKDTARITIVYDLLSINYLLLADYEKAEIYAKKQGIYARTSGDSVFFHKNKGNIYYESKRYEESSQSFKQAVLIAERMNNILMANDLRLALASSAMKMGKLDYALSEAQKTLDWAKERKDSLNYNYAAATVGEIYNAQHKYKESLSYLENTSRYFKREQNNNELLYKILETLSDTYAGLGKPEKALEIYKESATILREMQSSENKKLSANYESLYQLKEKEKEIVAKETENKIQTLNLAKEKQQKYLLLVMLLLALLSFLWALWNYRKNYILSQTLRAQKTTVEEQANLLREANQMKDKLFAMIGHDLRTPVTHLVDTLILWEMSMSKDVDAKTKSYFSKITIELENMQLILNNLLHWATLNIRNQPNHKSMIPLNRLVEKTIKQLEPHFAHKKLKVVRMLEEVNILADENQLQIIIRNILSNAIKFTHENGYIKVSLSKIDERVLLAMQDTGVGIPNNQIDKIFYFPTSSEGTQGEKGTGIGLSLCKELVEKNGGNIRINSEFGKGTEVLVDFLPLTLDMN